MSTDSKHQIPNLFISAGLMSGTSMDGIDGALLITDGQNYIEEIGSYSLDYDPQFKSLLKNCEKAVLANEGDLKRPRLILKKKINQLNLTK